jgi:DNA-binding NarL/FixJ family response regulator
VPEPDDLPPLTSLLETLELLLAQARAYEAALTTREAAARLAVARLGELAQKALNEAHDVSAALQTTSASNAPHPFSPREQEVLSLAALGLTNKEIAYRLGLSERTVQFHLNSVFNKTGTNSRTEAVALALRHAWLKERK